MLLGFERGFRSIDDLRIVGSRATRGCDAGATGSPGRDHDIRAMNKAAELVYETIRKEGTQKSVVDQMQTRDELYQRINYYDYENALDKFLKDGDKK